VEVVWAVSAPCPAFDTLFPSCQPAAEVTCVVTQVLPDHLPYSLDSDSCLCPEIGQAGLGSGRAGPPDGLAGTSAQQREQTLC
jgi:hypothetical protein